MKKATSVDGGVGRGGAKFTLDKLFSSGLLYSSRASSGRRLVRLGYLLLVLFLVLIPSLVCGSGSGEEADNSVVVIEGQSHYSLENTIAGWPRLRTSKRMLLGGPPAAIDNLLAELRRILPPVIQVPRPPNNEPELQEIYDLIVPHGLQQVPFAFFPGFIERGIDVDLLQELPPNQRQRMRALLQRLIEYYNRMFARMVRGILFEALTRWRDDFDGNGGGGGNAGGGAASGGSGNSQGNVFPSYGGNAGDEATTRYVAGPTAAHRNHGLKAEHMNIILKRLSTLYASQKYRDRFSAPGYLYATVMRNLSVKLILLNPNDFQHFLHKYLSRLLKGARSFQEIINSMITEEVFKEAFEQACNQESMYLFERSIAIFRNSVNRDGVGAPDYLFNPVFVKVKDAQFSQPLVRNMGEWLARLRERTQFFGVDALRMELVDIQARMGYLYTATARFEARPLDVTMRDDVLRRARAELFRKPQELDKRPLDSDLTTIIQRQYKTVHAAKYGSAPPAVETASVLSIRKDVYRVCMAQANLPIPSSAQQALTGNNSPMISERAIPANTFNNAGFCRCLGDADCFGRKRR